jgi:hypothetical protein
MTARTTLAAARSGTQASIPLKQAHALGNDLVPDGVPAFVPRWTAKCCECRVTRVGHMASSGAIVLSLT